MSKWIAMVGQHSGGRYDDRPWPPAGVPFEVPDEEADGLVGSMLAVWSEPLVSEPVPEPVSEPVPEPVAAPEPVFSPSPEPVSVPVSAPAPTAAGPALITEPEPEPVFAIDPDPLAAPPVPVDPPLPRPYAPKGEWVNYAIAHGATEDEANQATKDKLIADYGGRL